MVDEHRLREALRGGADPDATAEELLALALAAGGPDNVAVVVVDVG